MTNPEVLGVIREELARIAPEIDFATLDPRLDLREQADLDSMDFLNLITALHQRLAVDIPDAETQKLATLDGAVAYIQARRGPSPRRERATRRPTRTSAPHRGRSTRPGRSGG